WLNGTHEPRLGQLQAVATALGVSVGFLTGEGPNPPTEPRSSEAEDLVDGLARLKAAALLRPVLGNADELLDLLTAAERLAGRPGVNTPGYAGRENIQPIIRRQPALGATSCSRCRSTA